MPRPQKYPWDDWFATPGGAFTIEPGDDNVPKTSDVEGTLVSMRAQVHGQAKLRGVRVKTKIEGDYEEGDLVMHVQILAGEQASSQPPPTRWATLLDGQPHRLTPGRDFAGTAEAFIARAKTASRDKRIDIRVRQYEDGTVGLQAAPDGDPRPVSAFVKSLAPGIYRGADLLERCRAWQGVAAPVSPQELARELRDAGAERQRTGRGSIWSVR